jgi:hypothetical protein
MNFNEHLIRAETSRTELRDGIIDLYKGQSKITESLARYRRKVRQVKTSEAGIARDYSQRIS